LVDDFIGTELVLGWIVGDAIGIYNDVVTAEYPVGGVANPEEEADSWVFASTKEDGIKSTC